MRRYHYVALGFLGATIASASLAQNTPVNKKADIIRAMSAPSAREDAGDDGVIALPGVKQKGFSLGLSGGANKPAAAAPQRAAVAARPAPYTAARKPVVAPGRGARPSYGSALDMRVSFDLNSANLTEQGKAEARVFAEAVQSPELRGAKFIVAGHTDSSGSAARNQDLSKRRAQSVVDYLVAQGADRSRLVPAGYGFDRPRSGTNAADPSNRRVEFARAN